MSHAVALVASMVAGIGTLLFVRLLEKKAQGGPALLHGIGDLGGVLDSHVAIASAVGSALVVLFCGFLRRQAASPKTLGWIAGSLFLCLLAIGASPYGYFAAFVWLSGLFAGCVLVLFSRTKVDSPIVDDTTEAGRVPQRHDASIAAVLWGLVFAVAATFALHRQWSFGSGSWDMGCMVHNFFRAAYFLDTKSTVLGDVDFLGDHFMVGIYLVAPFFRIHPSATTLILIQSIHLSAAAPAIFLIARRQGAPRVVASSLALAAGFSFGLQSAHYFDAHEICVGFGFLAFGIWALESGRFKTATVLLVLFSLFKESLGAYVAALGLLVFWRGIRDQKKQSILYGLSWIAYGAVWFVVVNRVLMPHFIARGNPPEAHQTFTDFGPTVFSAMLGMVRDPLKVLVALVVPGEKTLSLLVTLSGVGWLCVFAPEILIAAAPLLFERFLSSKSTMWEMGYHYAAPLCLYAAWAAAVGWPKIHAALRVAAGSVLPDAPKPRMAPALAAYVLFAAGLTNGVGYRHPANFHRWNMDYFSTDDRKTANRHAVEFVLRLGRDTKVAAQNRILSHLAARPTIYRLGDHEKADLVVLSVGENAWPWDDDYARRLALDLHNRADFELVFAEHQAAVFARKSVFDLPKVTPTPVLGIRVDAPLGER